MPRKKKSPDRDALHPVDNVGFLSIPRICLFDQELSATAFRLYCYMCHKWGDKHTCFPHLKTIMVELGIKKTRLWECIKELEEKGLIEKAHRKTRYGGQNVYVNCGLRSAYTEEQADKICLQAWGRTAKPGGEPDPDDPLPESGTGHVRNPEQPLPGSGPATSGIRTDQFRNPDPEVLNKEDSIKEEASKKADLKVGHIAGARTREGENDSERERANGRYPAQELLAEVSNAEVVTIPSRSEHQVKARSPSYVMPRKMPEQHKAKKDEKADLEASISDLWDYWVDLLRRKRNVHGLAKNPAGKNKGHLKNICEFCED